MALLKYLLKHKFVLYFLCIAVIIFCAMLLSSDMQFVKDYSLYILGIIVLVIIILELTT